jgi:hypothetical protein
MATRPTYQELENNYREFQTAYDQLRRSVGGQLPCSPLAKCPAEEAIRWTAELEQLLSEVLASTLSIMGCDRVWLLNPCDPDAEACRITMECNRPEYPSTSQLNQDLPITPEMVRIIKAALGTAAPVVLHPEAGLPLTEMDRRFSIQSTAAIALYPSGVRVIREISSSDRAELSRRYLPLSRKPALLVLAAHRRTIHPRTIQPRTILPVGIRRR